MYGGMFGTLRGYCVLQIASNLMPLVGSLEMVILHRKPKLLLKPSTFATSRYGFQVARSVLWQHIAGIRCNRRELTYGDDTC
jgi:hypothetical protein